MIRKTIFALATLASTAQVAPATAEGKCVPDSVTITTSDLKIDTDREYVEFDLLIANNSGIDLGGLIVNYTLTLPDRPSALASAPSQLAHTLHGGLLAGESTTIRDGIDLSQHAAGLILTPAAQARVELSAKLDLIADIAMRPIGQGYDPFGLWQDAASPVTCP